MSFLRARTLRSTISALRIQCRSLHCTARLAQKHDPLRILYCGSDNFSVTHLRALVEEKERNPSLIQSIDVVHPPAKRTGRGLKNLTEVPVAELARSFSLPTHSPNGLKDWNSPPIDLIIAVSIREFVPSKLISQSTYGGINVHPSLLPDLAGAAPIHHALLERDPYTGVTVQTLHPAEFDAGAILAQKQVPLTYPDPITLLYPDNPVPVRPGQLLTDAYALLAENGSNLLLHVLRNALFVPPLHPVPPIPPPGNRAPRLARRLHKSSDHKIDWETQTARELVHRNLVLGDLWCDKLFNYLKHGLHSPTGTNPIRTIFHSIVPGFASDPEFKEKKKDAFFVGTCIDPSPPWNGTSGQGVWLREGTIEGMKRGGAAEKFRTMKKAVDSVDSGDWWAVPRAIGA